MANDNLTKGRIAKLEKQITEAGLTMPVLQDDLSLQEREATLREFYKANKTDGATGMSALFRQADLRGIFYEEDIDEDLLKQAIKDHDAKMKEESTKNMEARKAEAEVPTDILAVAKEIGEGIARGIESSNSMKEKGEERFVTERQYDPADLVPAKTYFAPMIYYKLPMKRVGGQQVRPPFGKIEFKMMQGSSVRVGNQNQTRYLCAYTTDSRREQAYIETHPRYKKTFYPSDTQARITSDEHKYAIKFGQRHNVLKTFQAPALYSLASSMDIPLDTNMGLDAIRDVIAGEQAKMDMIHEKNHRQELIRTGEREALLHESGK